MSLNEEMEIPHCGNFSYSIASYFTTEYTLLKLPSIFASYFPFTPYFMCPHVIFERVSYLEILSVYAALRL